MTQDTQTLTLRGIAKYIDTYKVFILTLLSSILIVQIAALIFISMFGNIIANELRKQHEDVLVAIDDQNDEFYQALKSIHPHFLIASPIYDFVIKEGVLYVNDSPITTQKDLDLLLMERNKVFKRLEDIYDHH
jgi:hypothetical protein